MKIKNVKPVEPPYTFEALAASMNSSPKYYEHVNSMLPDNISQQPIRDVPIAPSSPLYCLRKMV